MSDSAEHSATGLSPTELPTAGHAPGLGANKLGVIAIAFFVIAAAAPMAAAILTPGPDVFSQCMLAVPVMGLYELGILLVAFGKPKTLATGS